MLAKSKTSISTAKSRTQQNIKEMAITNSRLMKRKKNFMELESTDCIRRKWQTTCKQYSSGAIFSAKKDQMTDERYIN